MRQWTLIYLIIAVLIPALALSEATPSSLAPDLADRLDIKENAFAKLSDDPEVTEVDVEDRSREVALFGLIRLPSSGEGLLQDLPETQGDCGSCYVTSLKFCLVMRSARRVKKRPRLRSGR